MRVVTAKELKIEGVDEPMGENGAREAAQDIVHGPEDEPGQGSPHHPDPSARTRNLVEKTEEDRLRNHTYPRRQEGSKEQLLPRARQNRQQQDHPRRKLLRDGTQILVETTGPGQTVHGQTSEEDDDQREGQPGCSRPELARDRRQHDPWLRVQERIRTVHEDGSGRSKDHEQRGEANQEPPERHVTNLLP